MNPGENSVAAGAKNVDVEQIGSTVMPWFDNVKRLLGCAVCETPVDGQCCVGGSRVER